MAWHLHITEGENGRWSCSRGRFHFDTHEDVFEAVSHLREMTASLDGPAMVIIHRLDGVVEKIGSESDPRTWSGG